MAREAGGFCITCGGRFRDDGGCPFCLRFERWGRYDPSDRDPWGRLPKRSLEEPTRLQEPEPEPDPDAVYETMVEQRREADKRAEAW